VAKQRKKTGGIQGFYRETIAELRKVSWPTRSEAINLSRVVLIVIVIVGAFLGILDYLFSRMFGLILGA
jgi:preprotein translocase subunit SecE